LTEAPDSAHSGGSEDQRHAAQRHGHSSAIDFGGNSHHRCCYARNRAAVSGAAILQTVAVRLPLPPHPHLFDTVGNLRNSISHTTWDPVFVPSR
jgi:hypothetical protein